MPRSEPVTILIISEHAESIKLITLSLRGFFSGCRVDVAYSTEEARAWSSPHEWTMILIDEQCLAEDRTSLPGELKQRAPYAGIILLSDRTDSAAAIHALQADVDFFLSKQSPAFLTELLFCARQTIDTFQLRTSLNQERERQHRLVELLSDIVYELDADGCFVTVSSGIATLLGYSSDELIGLPYTTLVPPGQETAARFCLNERRSGARSASRIELTLQGKSQQANQPLMIAAEVSARGLYDTLRRFLGTVGLIRDLSQSKQQDTTILQLHQQLRRTDELHAMAQRVTRLSQQLSDPLASLLAQSQQLLTTIRDAHLERQTETLAGYAAEATKLGEQLARALQEKERATTGRTINDVLDAVLTSNSPNIMEAAGITRQFASTLPPLIGDHEQVTKLIYQLLNYAQTHILTVGRAHRLIVSTRAVGSPSVSADDPVLFPLDPPTEVEIELLESDRERLSEPPATAFRSTDLIESYQIVRQLGGALDVSAPMQGPLRIILRLPISSRSLTEIRSQPLAPSDTSVTLTPASKIDTTTSIFPTTSGRPQSERRHSPRVLTTLPATITVGSTTWEGVIANLGLGGACITLPNNFPALALQDAYVVIKTSVGILELQSTAQNRPISFPVGTWIPTSHLIVTFVEPKQEEAAVLASFVQAAQEQDLSFSIEIQLAAEPHIEPTTIPPPLVREQKEYDPRESVRVDLQLPVRLDITDPAGNRYRFDALIVNLSRGGACLHLAARLELLSGIAMLHFTTIQTQKHPGTHEPGAPDSVLAAQIVWSAPNPTAARKFRDQDLDPEIQIGLRFHGLTPYAEREVSRIVQQYLTATDESEGSLQQTSIVSIPRECRNPRGQTIVITDDHLRQSLAPNTPVIIIAPGYGQTALDASVLSYYLAQHRLRILRYDHSNHVGLSDGELEQTTLRSMQADLTKVVEFVHDTWPTAPLIVMASDLTARVAIKMAVQSRPLDLLLLINPVVDIQALLTTIHGHDLVADHGFGLRFGIANLLGLIVNVDRFLGDLVAGQLTDLTSTLADLRLLRAPTAILTIPNSPLGPWPPADLPQAFLTALGTHTSLATVPAPLIGQELPLDEAHPQAFRQILGQIASTVLLPTIPAQFHAQTRHLLARQQRNEMERTRLRHNLSQFTREAMRFAHLQQVPQLGNLHEYWKLLDDLYRLLSPLEPGSVLVDVGVGHGDLLRATMVNLAYRTRQHGWSPERPVHAIGLESSYDALTHARQSLRALHREIDNDFAGALASYPPMTTEWVQADWTQRLPFKDHSIHRIVCNLALPFVPSPLATIQDLYRILHPQGRLVLTAFHPDTDLSVLYRKHLRKASQDEFSPHAHIVLHYLGRLRESIRHGLLHTFSQPMLTSLFQQAGILTPRILPALDGHAFIAVIEKSKSAG